MAAAYELQSRLWNMLCGGFLQEPAGDGQFELEAHYARHSTVWLVAQYLGCMELVRREAPFVPVADERKRGKLQVCLDDIRKAFASDTGCPEPVFRVHRAWQRAIGELMIVHDLQSGGEPMTRCMGFAEFTRALTQEGSALAPWCRSLIEGVETLAEDPSRADRVCKVQHALVNLVDLLDRDLSYFPHDRSIASWPQAAVV